MNKPTPEKIRAYINNELSAEEKKEIGDWISENRDNPLLVGILKTYWHEIDEYRQLDASRSAFRDFELSIGGFPSQKTSVTRLFLISVRNVAALLAIPFLILSVFFWNRVSPADLDYTEFAVPYGKQDSIRLPDNTMVWLNSGSRIIYPLKFEGQSRQVFISGEAFFDVETDQKRPFILKAQEISIQVLGTKFNVNAYEGTDALTVSLVEGSVVMHTGRAQGGDNFTMIPGDVIRYNKTTGSAERTQISTEAFCSWRRGGFYFNNHTLSDITAQFERVFNVKILILDEQLRQTRYTLAFVNGESLEQMLDAINLTGRMNIINDSNTGVITIK